MVGIGSWNAGNRVLECWEWDLGMVGIGSWNGGNRVLECWE